MSGHGLKLHHKQDSAIAALLTANSVTAAAQSIGLNEKTLVRWLQDDGFQRAYRTARQTVVDHAIHQVVPHVSAAIQTLVGIMQDADTLAKDRISAAKGVLDTAFKVLELQDLEQRLANLEAVVRESTP